MLSKEELSKITFTNLVQQSHWSIPLGIGGVKKQLVGTLQKGLNGMALTDDNIMSGIFDLYKLQRDKDLLKALNKNKFPIALGVKQNFTDDLDNKDLSRIFKLTLYAKSQIGYQNIIYLNSISSDPDHYLLEHKTKRLSISELFERTEGVIVGSGGIDGILSQAILKDTGQEEELIEIFKETFQDDFFIEIHFHPIKTEWDSTQKKYISMSSDSQKKVNLRLIELGKKHNVKMCLVQDSFMLEKKHIVLQNILIQNHPDYKKSGWYVDSPKWVMSVPEMYEFIKKESDYITDEMFIEFCNNTQDIVKETDKIRFHFSPSLPAIDYASHPTNTDSSYEDKIKELKENIKDISPLMSHLIDVSEGDISLRTTIKSMIRLNKINWTDREEVQRLAFELRVMQRNGGVKLCDYFLLLEDVTNYVRSIGKYRGHGRGSGGGSLLTYAMDISDVMPIEFGLLFERFLTQERIITMFFDIPNYPFVKVQNQPIENPYYEKIKQSFDQGRLKEVSKEYLEKELFYLECHPSVAEYVFKTYESMVSKGEKYDNSNNSTISYLLKTTDVLPSDEISQTPTTLPDFDYDSNAREEIKEYLVNKYGKNHTTLLGTIGTLRTKGAIKDVIRQLRPLRDENGVTIKPEMTFDEVNNLTKKFDLLKVADFKTEISFFEATLAADANTKKWFQENPDIEDALRMILGNAKSLGIHAGGIVVSSKNVLEVMPMTWSFDENMWITQAEMGFVEWAGLIKYDFLGLKTLDDIMRCINLIEERHGIRYNLPDISLDDQEVLDLFVQGKTESIFQFNTSLAVSILVRLLKITSVVDLAIITSIARPGPLNMGMEKVFIERNNGREPVSYMHPSLESILKETLGILCFQEQISKIAQDIGHFDGDASVDLMKSLSKKVESKVLKHKDKFVAEASKIMPIQKVDEIFEHMLSFAAYGFNKSHAVAYACVSYLSMWFKHYYPIEWKTAVLTGATKDDFKILYPKWKDSIEKPDINKSKNIYIIVDEKIIMPFSSINSVGVKAVENIVLNQPYSSFKDFFNKVDKSKVNKRTILNMIFSGVFDSMNEGGNSVPRWRKLLVLEYFKLKYELKKPGKKEKEEDDIYLKNAVDLNRGEILLEEISLLNFTAFDYFEYYSDKMSTGAKSMFGKEAIRPNEVQDYPNDAIVVVGGSIEEIVIAPVKNPNSKIFGQEMVRMKLSNEGETIDVVLFPKQLAQDDEAGGMIRKLKQYTPIVIKGRVSRFGGGLSLTYEAGWNLL